MKKLDTSDYDVEAADYESTRATPNDYATLLNKH